MLYQKMTAADAVKHFERNGYKEILPDLKQGKKKEYDRVRKIVSDAKRGIVSDSRARSLLEMYGGSDYRVSTSFEVAITEGNGKRFAELSAEFREKFPDAFDGWHEERGESPDKIETKTEIMNKHLTSAIASGKTFPNLIKLEDACARATAIQPEWKPDFKAIERKYYTEETAKTGVTLLNSASELLLALKTEQARRYIDVALSKPETL